MNKIDRISIFRVPEKIISQSYYCQTSKPQLEFINCSKILCESSKADHDSKSQTKIHSCPTFQAFFL